MSSEKNGRGKATLAFLKGFLTGKVILAIAGVLAVVLIGIGIRRVVSFESTTTRIGFEDIGELATQAAYCTEVNVTEASRELWGVTIPFTQSKYIYSYDVEIKAGLDFGDIQWTLDEENQIIRVSLPEIRVLSRELDPESFQLYHEEESIFRQITMEENNQALTTLLETAEKDAVANGLLDDARRNAEDILRVFFASAYDLEQYEIRFTDQ